MDLKALGLNRYETLAYEAVIEHGRSTAAIIAQKSGVPYGRIYDVLASLENQGLVQSIPGKTKYFEPGDPENLSNLLKQKKADLVAAEKSLEHLKQVYEEHGSKPVQIAQGHANFFRLMKQLPPKKEFDYSIKYTSLYRPEWVRTQKRHVEEGIVTKSLSRLSTETEKDIRKWLAHRDDIREFDNKGVAIAIGDTGVLIGLISKDTTIVIKDEAFIDVMKRLFEATYDKSPRITPHTFKKRPEIRKTL